MKKKILIISWGKGEKPPRKNLGGGDGQRKRKNKKRKGRGGGGGPSNLLTKQRREERTIIRQVFFVRGGSRLQEKDYPYRLKGISSKEGGRDLSFHQKEKKKTWVRKVGPILCFVGRNDTCWGQGGPTAGEKREATSYYFPERKYTPLKRKRENARHG